MKVWDPNYRQVIDMVLRLDLAINGINLPLTWRMPIYLLMTVL